MGFPWLGLDILNQGDDPYAATTEAANFSQATLVARWPEPASSTNVSLSHLTQAHLATRDLGSPSKWAALRGLCLSVPSLIVHHVSDPAIFGANQDLPGLAHAGLLPASDVAVDMQPISSNSRLGPKLWKFCASARAAAQ